MRNTPTSTPTTLLAESLELTRKMLASGEVGAWDRVVELAATRSDRLDAAFAASDVLTDKDGLCIQEILNLNQRLGELGRLARDKVANELSESKRGRKVTAAYHQSGA